MNSRPDISVVVVARNDDYGRDFLGRTNVFLRSLLSSCEEKSYSAELVVVEWNPPASRPSLVDSLDWDSVTLRTSSARVVRVPQTVHEMMPNPAQLPLYEYLGKNVGVRRAKGRYVITTNPDIIFGRSLVEFLFSGKLRSHCFYRADRYDVRTPVPDQLSIPELMNYCSGNVIRRCTRTGTFSGITGGPGFRDRLVRARTIMQGQWWRRLHTNAAGDFFLADREAWFSLRGYPELERYGKSHRIDGLILYQAANAGLRQCIIRTPAVLYHQEHERPETGKPMSEAVQAAFADLRKRRHLTFLNDENWGLGDFELNEVRIR